MTQVSGDPVGVPYSTTFESGIGTEWSSSRINNDYPATFTRFTGPFANETQALSLSGLTPGTSYTIGFDLYIIDSWDGIGFGPDVIDINIDGTSVFHETFSNYNGNPPSSPQSYPENPDVGRMELGFVNGWVDSIYRRIEVAFVPAASTSLISFSGQNLEGVGNESWGLDNIVVDLSSSLAQTVISSTSLPANGATRSFPPIDTFSIVASRKLEAASAGTQANYFLREAGPNHTFGDSDDLTISTIPTFSGSKTVSFTLNPQPLQPGMYRLEVQNLADFRGSAVAAFTTEFVVENPAFGVVEDIANDTIPGATPLTMSTPQDGFSTGFGVGTFVAVPDIDYWRFDAEAGDLVSVHVNVNTVGAYPQIYLQTSAGNNLASTGGSYEGNAMLQNIRIPAPGTYYVAIRTDNGKGAYKMRVDRSRGLQLEQEANDGIGSANFLNTTGGAGTYQARIAGATIGTDSAGDFYRLGVLNVGNAISAAVAIPAGSELTPSDVTLEIYLDGALVNSQATTSLNFTATQDGLYYIHVKSSNLGIRSQYVLTATVTDGVPPGVTSLGLPDEGSTTTGIIDEITVDFSEELNSTISKLARDIRVFGGHNYFLGDSATSWTLSEAQALTSGGHLVAINSAAENTFVLNNFRSSGDIWIGLNDAITEGTFEWSNGDPFVYANWSGGQPDNSGNEDYAGMFSNGTWNDFPGGTNLRGVVEVAGTDADGDGLLDGIDAFPSDALNVFELRHAGSDGVFGNSDDVVYQVRPDVYTSGQSVLLKVLDGPMQPGNYRFTVTTSLKDRAGNALSAPFTRSFVVANPGGYQFEKRNTDARVSATSLSASPGSAPDGSFTYSGNTQGTGANPWFITAGDYDGDGETDLAVANYGGNTISILRNGASTGFLVLSNYPTAGNPIALAQGDLNGDGKLDLVAAAYGGSRAIVLLGNGDGTFAQLPPMVTGSNPRSVVVADVNGDGKLDILTANESSANISVFLGAGDGSFGSAVNFASGPGPFHVQARDLNNDGKVDVVVANQAEGKVSVLLGNGDGTFAARVAYTSGSGTRSVGLADVNADGKIDIVALNEQSHDINVLLGAGDGAFTSLAVFATGLSDVYHLVLGDLNGDGKLDAAVAAYGSSRIAVMLGQGDGSFLLANTIGESGNPIAVALGDFNRDGIVDIASANYGGNAVGIAYGNPVQPLVEDPAGSGFRTGAGRGKLSSDSDVDFWSFTGREGDRVVLAVDVPGNPGASSLIYTLQNSSGEQLTAFGSDYTGFGQSTPVILPSDGTYYVQVSPNYQWHGEYRLRVALAPEPTQVEVESNDQFSQANVVTLTAVGTHQTATVSGYMSVSDASGDFYSLGNFSEGASISLTVRQPSTGGFPSLLNIFDAGGNLKAASIPGAMTVSYAVPAGGEGAYYARITDADPLSAVLFAAQYILDIDISDTVAPVITEITLPEEGSRRTFVPATFSITFSEDMLRTTLANSSNYELRSAGPNNTFDDSDDSLYGILFTASPGLTASYQIPDGPLQPGRYRFTAKTSITDRSGNGLATPVLRHFEVLGVSGFLLENRNNDSITTPTTISLSPGTTSDGSFQQGPTALVGGQNPWYVLPGKFNGDAHLDLAVANYGGGRISVLLGNGDQTFQAYTTYTVGSGPISIASADLNGDGVLDLGVANNNSSVISVLLGLPDGTFGATVNYGVGSNPRSIASGDFNGDGKADFAVANQGSANVSILLGQGNGTFLAKANYAAGASPHSIITGDFNKDGKLDLAVALESEGNVSILLGSGDGQFGTPVKFTCGGAPRSIAKEDFNQDGNEDIVSLNASDNTVSVLLGNGDGTFLSAAAYPAGSSDPYQVIAGDLNADGKADVAVAAYGNSRVLVLLGRGDGTLNDANPAPMPGNPISLAVGDFDEDGIQDIATANYGSGTAAVLRGNRTEFLAEDPPGSGIRTGTGRGNLATATDRDFWSFSANAGDRLIVASDVPGNPAGSGLFFDILKSGGEQLTSFVADYTGFGQSTPVVIPASGHYYVVVQANYGYLGEYRLRVTLAPSSSEFEVEPNNGVASATPTTLTLNRGHQTGRYVGYLSIGDLDGDFYKLGNLSEATLISLDVSRPNSSQIEGMIELYNSQGFVTASSPNVSHFSYLIPPGGANSYYARFVSVPASRSGDAGPYLSFDGSNDYVNAGTWAPGTAWTVEAWVNPSSLPGGRRTIAGSMNECRDWGITLQDGHFGVVIRPPGGCSQTLVAAEAASVNLWYHVLGTSDGTTARLYVNGALMASGPVEANYLPTASGVFIGSEVCCAGDNFPGLIDEVSIWNRSFTEVEAQNASTAVLAGNEAELKGYWRLEEGTGASIADSSTAAPHPGTLVNGPVWVAAGTASAGTPGLNSQYMLDFDLSDTTPPTIAGISLPAEGSTTTFVGPIFTVNFSEDMALGTVTDAANYELAGSGPDGVFGNGDDEVYSVLNLGYSSGLSTSYRILNGPIQPGKYKFTISTGLTDKGGTPLASAVVRQFTMENVPGYILENRGSEQFRITSLAQIQGTTPDGSIGFFQNLAEGGSNPWGIAAGKFDGDNNLDVAIANSGSANVSVMLGDGNETFHSATTYPVGSSPRSIATGDFNKDGKLDLVTANVSGNSVSVLRGNGDGTFQSAVNTTAGSSPHTVAVGDFNGDGNADLVTANNGASDVSVLIGRGDGTFNAQVKFPTGGSGSSRPVWVTTGDLNGDGNLDIVTANSGNGTATVMFGDGAGSFSTVLNLGAGSGPRSIAVGDLNGDGKADILVLNADNNISVILNNGGGSFATQTTIPTGTSDSYQIILADWNADGKLDIGAASYGSSRVILKLGKGDGTFEPGGLYPVSGNPIALVAGQFGSDGFLDIATANYGNATVGMLNGNVSELLQEDPSGSGIRTVLGRGYISDATDADYYSFSANEGDRVVLAVETPGRPSSSGLFYEIKRPDGTQLTSFGGNFDGTGQTAPVVLPMTGNYFVVVSRYYDYFGEYRFRLSVAPPGVQLESPGATTGVPFGLDTGHLKATELGYLSGSDGGGDLYDLGVLSSGVGISLQIKQPSTSGFAPIMDVLDANGVILVNSVAGATTLNFNTPVGGKYFVKVTGDFGPGAQKFEGVDGNAIRFGDHNANVQAPDSPSLRPTSLTLEGWANFNSASGVRVLFGKTLGNSYLDSYALWYQDGFLRGIVSSLNNGGTTVEKAWTPEVGRWYHIAFTFDDSSKQEKLYIDGVLQATATTSVTIGYDNHPFIIGAEIENESLNYLFGGKIDEVRLWNVARGQTEIQADMARRLMGNESGLVGFWRFDEGSGTVAGDLTANQNHAALVNFPVWVDSSPRNLSSSGFLAEYILSIDLSPSLPPTVLSSTLPTGSTTPIIDRFSLSFSQDLSPASVNDAASYDLRAAGGDGNFDTGDDEVYHLQPATFTTGLSESYTITDGPLQTGNYRFTVSGVQNRFGQPPATPYLQFFSLGAVSGFVNETRNNNAGADATPLVLIEDPTGLKSGGGRGNLLNSSDNDYWSFSGEAGQKLVVAVDVPGNPSASALEYRILKPDSSLLFSLIPVYTGYGQSSVLSLPSTGTYRIQVRAYYDYQGEYRLRVMEATAPMQLESEDNDDVAHGTAVSLDVSGNTRFGTVAGHVRFAGDLDYFNLGVVASGTSIFLSSRVPETSHLIPTVAVYDASNGYMVESGGGRAFDGVAEVRITQTGNYYAVMRGADGTGSLTEQYVMDIQAIPTGSIQFPNLQVTSVSVPGGLVLSGSINPISFTVKNLGNVATPSGSWSDRVVMSRNTILGDADDVPLGTFAHSGVLNPDGAYTVNTDIAVPDGISGAFFLIVQTDVGNAINEFVLEGDNITVSGSAFTVQLAPYADLKIEDLLVSAPDIHGTFTVSWKTANRGNGNVTIPFHEQVVVRNRQNLATLVSLERNNIGGLAVNAAALDSITVTPAVAAEYDVIVVTDSSNNLFEMDAVSHANAELNTVQARFTAVPLVTIAVSANPSVAGDTTGSGTYATGTLVTVVATPSSPSYVFSSWTQNGTFQTASSSYTFSATQDRTLVANFLPVSTTHTVNAGTTPSGVAVISGAGTYNNGDVVHIVAPVTGDLGGVAYVFKRFTLNGSPAGTSASISKTLGSGDAQVLNYVAEYEIAPTTPGVTSLVPSRPSPAMAGANFSVKITFDRTMDTSVEPAVIVTNRSVALGQSAPSGGTWLTSTLLNDTYETPKFSLMASLHGNNIIAVSEAIDPSGLAMEEQLFPDFIVDAIAPVIDDIRVTAGSVYAIVTWLTDEPARGIVTLSTGGGSTIISSNAFLQSSSFLIEQLEPETAYDFTVTAVDPAGNTTISASTRFTTTTGGDLEVTRITLPPTAYAGKSVNLSWTVHNKGPVAAGAPWKDSVYVATGPEGENARLLASFEVTSVLESDDSYTSTHLIELPADLGVGDRWIVVRTDSESQVDELDESNNSMISATALAALPTFALSLSPTSLLESVVNPGSIGTISRNGVVGTDVTVDVSSDDTGAARVPNTVVFPGGATSVTFPITIINDSLNNADRTVHITVSASDFGSANATLTVRNDNSLNHPPVLSPIADQTIAELQTLTITAIAEDADVPANVLHFSFAEAAPTGMMLDAATGVLSWTPTEGQGPFTNLVLIKVEDDAISSLSSTQTVQIVVTEVNTAPVVNIPNQTVELGATFSLVVPATDSDIPANQLSFQLLSGPSGLNLNPNTGAFSWTPGVSDVDGVFGVSLRVTDNGDPALHTDANFNIHVISPNTAPVLNSIGNVAINEQAPFALTATAVDHDVLSNVITYSLSSGAPAGLSINPTTGEMNWTPAEFDGPDIYTVTVIAADNGTPSLNDQKTFTITVQEANRAPTISRFGDAFVRQGDLLTLNASATDPDLPANRLAFSLSGAPSGMSINSVTGQITWRPARGQGGRHLVTLQVTDDGVPALNDATTFFVVVDELNSAPVISVIPDTSVNEGSTVVAQASAVDNDTVANSVRYSLGAAPAGMSIDPFTGVLSWTTVESDGPAVYNVTVVASDNGTPSLSSQTSFRVTVQEVNRAPALSGIPDATVAEGSEFRYTATANDSDTPANHLTFSLAAGAPAGMQINATAGSITWTPTEEQGPNAYFVTVIVTDDGSPNLQHSQSFQITVTEGNTAPILAAFAAKTVEEGAALVVQASATDSDKPANTFTYSLVNPPVGMTIEPATGRISWAPAENQGGSTYVLTVQVTDDGVPALSDSKDLTVTVTELNSAPVLSAIADAIVAEGSLFSLTLSASDSDQPANTLTFALGAGAPAGLTLDPVSGVLKWTPGESDGPGTYPVTVLVTDNGTPALSASRSFQITVNEANSAPVLGTIGTQTVFERGTLEVRATATDSDLPSNLLTFSLGAGSPPAALIDSLTGNIRWTPQNADAEKTHSFTVVVRDNGTPALTDTKTFQVVVTGINDPPHLALLGLVSTFEDTETAFAGLSISDVDAGNGQMELRLRVTNGVVSVGSVAGLNFVASANGTSNIVVQGTLASLTQALQGLVYQAKTNFSGTDALEISINDQGNTGTGGALLDAGTVPITIRPVNDAPTLGGIADIFLGQGSSSPVIPFSVGDLESAPTSLDVTATSSNQLLLPDERLVLGGAGLSRTIKVTPLASESGTADVTVTVSDPSGQSSSTTFRVTVNPVKPIVVSQPSDTVLLAGGTLSFGVTATGTLPIGYQWYRNNVLLPDRTNSLLVISGVQTIDAGVYRAELVNVAGTNTTGGAQVTVIVPPSIATPPDAQSVLAGETATFRVIATGSEPLHYQWRFNGELLSGQIFSTLVLPEVAPEQAGDYSVDVSNDGGNASSVPVRLTVAGKPRIVTPPLSQAVIAGSSVTLTVGVEGQGPFTYHWTRNTADLLNANGATLQLSNITPGQQGDYAVRVGNAAGEVTSPAAAITVQESVVITQEPVGSTNRVGENALLVVGATGTGPLSYQWYFEGAPLLTETNATLALNNLQSIQSGLYSVDVINPVGPVRSREALVKVFVTPFITRQPASQVVLEGTDALFTVIVSGTEPMSYYWLSNNVPTGAPSTNTFLLSSVPANGAASYSVIVSNYAGTATSTPVTLGINSPVQFTTQPVGTTVREGSPVSFTAAVTGTPPISFQWQFDGKDLPGANTAVLNLTTPSPLNSGTYQLIARNPYGTNASAEAILDVMSIVQIVNGPVDVDAHAGDNVSFDVLASGSGPIFYQWRREGTNLPNATNATLLLSNITTNNGGRYSVSVSNTVSAILSSAAFLNVLVPPVITPVSPLVQTLNLGQTAVFQVTATGGAPITFQWLRNGLLIPDATNETYTIANLGSTNGGIYTVVASNPGGLASSPEFNLKINLPTFLLTDLFADKPLTNGGSGAFFGGNNSSASKEAGERDHGGKPGGKSMWFSWQSPITGTARFRTTGSTFDTLLSVYTGTSLANLVEVASDDDSGTAGASEVSFNVTTGTVYHFGLDGLVGSFGNIIMSWETTPGLQGPTILVQPLSQTILVTSNVTFSVVAQGQAGDILTYQWYKDTATLPGATSPNLTINGVNVSHVGSYTVRVSNGRIVESQAALLEVTLIETGDEGPGVSAIDKPLFLRGHLQSIGGQKLRILASVARGFTGAQVFSTKTAIKDPGEPNHCGIVGGASSWFVYQAPTNGTLRVDTLGSDFDTILAIYTGPGTDYQSLINVACDNDSAGDVNRRLSMVTFPIVSGTTYFIVVDGVKAARGTVQLNYSVAQAPDIVQQPLIEITLPPQTISGANVHSLAADNLVPLGGGIKLTVTATNRLAPAALGYQWMLNGSSLLGATSSTLILTNVGSRQSGDYTVVVANYAGKTTSTPIHVTVTSPVNIISAPQDQTAIPGASAKFTVAATGSQLRYQWRFNNGDIPNATNDTYTVNNVQPVNAGTYTVVVSNTVNSKSASGVLSFTEPPNISTQPVGQTVLAGATVNLSVSATGAGPLGYQWRFNGVNMPGATSSSLVLNNINATGAGDYTVVVSNVVRSVVSSIARVIVNTPIAILQQPQGENTTPGKRVLLEVVVSGSAPLTYQWKRNGANVGGATGSVLDLPNIQTVNAGTYQVTVSNGAGSIDSQPVQVNVNVPPGITTQPQDANVTAGSLAVFNVTATGTGPLQYQWRLNGATIPGATSATLSLNGVGSGQAGTYTVIVSNDGGQVVSSGANLNVTSGVTINSQPRDLTVVQGASATFSVLATGTGQLQYQWKFKGSPIPGATGPTLTIAAAQQPDAGAYTVDVSNVLGTVGSSPASLVVSADAPVRISSPAITANGFQISMSGPVGASFSLETSTNMTTWTSLTNFTFGVNNFVYTDENSANFVLRFYRLVSKPGTQSIRASVSSIETLVDGRIKLTFDGNAGQRYLLQSSADLRVWVEASSGTLTGSATEVTLPNGGGNSHLFYRLIVVP